MVGIPGIANRARMLVMPGGAERELHHVEPGDIERAGSIEPVQRGCGRARHETVAQLRAAAGGPFGTVIHVLVAERHTVQRPDRPSGIYHRVGLGGGSERRCRVRSGDAIEGISVLPDPFQREARQLDGSKITIADAGGGGLQRHEGIGVHRTGAWRSSSDR